MNKDIAISVKNLTKVYNPNSSDKNLALDNISLEIYSGSIFGLLGPNGAGKSTFINILADLVRKTSGDINILGIDYQTNLKKVKKLMGIVPQELNIDPFFTPLSYLKSMPVYMESQKKIGEQWRYCKCLLLMIRLMSMRGHFLEE